jgi:threonine/homoserine/homoserine lactone efflux protein
MNTAVDVAVTFAASAVRDRLAKRPTIIRRMRQTSGGILCALGVTLALAKRPA